MTNTPAPLDKIRSQIDLLDVDLVHLLAAREHLVRQAGRLKTDTAAVRAPTRVERVVAQARATAAEAGATPDIVERIYRAMVAAFVDLELKHHAQGADPLIEPAHIDDAGELLTLQRAAYATEARIYGDPTLPPLVQTLDELIEELDRSLAFKATVGRRIIGAVRAQVTSGVLHIGRLTVAPDYQGRGLGTALLDTVEHRAGPDTYCATLFTGHRSLANLRLYERLGYVEDRHEELKPGVVLVHLTKPLVHGDSIPSDSEL